MEISTGVEQHCSKSNMICMIQEKVRDEAHDETSRGGRKLAGIRGLPRTTRFDDPSMVRKHIFRILLG